MSQLKVLCFSGIAFSLVFSGFSLVFYFGDWSRLILVACFGLFIGFLAAPEFAPKAFKKAWVIQLICGAIAGVGTKGQVLQSCICVDRVCLWLDQ